MTGCISLLAGCAPQIVPATSPATSTPRYAVTTDRYPESTVNLNGVCSRQFGVGFRVADWRDLTDAARTPGLLETVYRTSGWAEVGELPNNPDVRATEVYVVLDGQPNFTPDRHYFAAWHHGQVPGGFLVHESIDGNLVSLGSWHGARPVLCVRVA
jgi:hypothetical protein